MKEFNRPTMLMILDGYGINQDTYGNAIAAADKSHLDEIFAKYPGTTLKACGLDVGLPEGQMGNSEVGHLNIGAGRIVTRGSVGDIAAYAGITTTTTYPEADKAKLSDTGK